MIRHYARGIAVGGAGCPSRLDFAAQARWDPFDILRASSALHLRRPSIAIGFTLLEMIVAMAIGTIVLIMLGGALKLTVRGTEQMRGIMHQARLQAGVERILRRDLELAFKAGEKGLTFVGRTPSSGGVIMEFTSQCSYNPGRTPPAGLVRIEYSLAPSARFSGGWELRRREMTFIPGKPVDRSKSQPEPLADGVSALALSFYDGARWNDSWRRDVLPALIKMELRFAENESDPGLSPQIEYYFRPCVDPGAEALP